MTDRTPVRDRALRLQSEVRRLEAGAQEEGQANRIARRVAEVDAALARLAGHVRAARALQRHTTVTITLRGLEAGRDDLARRAAGAIPGDAAFTAARRKVETRAGELGTEIQAGWKAWADEQLSALPTRRIGRMDNARQEPARATVKRLRTLAATPSLTAADIAEFATAYEGLKEELDEAADVPEALQNLIDRLSRGPVLLTTVSDGEIALLRLHAMDGEIELRRKAG
jgi:hypothetical protein